MLRATNREAPLEELVTDKEEMCEIKAGDQEEDDELEAEEIEFEIQSGKPGNSIIRIPINSQVQVTFFLTFLSNPNKCSRQP